MRRPPLGDPDPPPGPEARSCGFPGPSGISASCFNFLWFLFANDLPTVMFFLGPFSLLPLTFLLLVFLDATRLFASCVGIVIHWTPSRLFPWLLAFTGVYLSFVAIVWSSLFLLCRVGAGPPNSLGWLDGGARRRNPGSKVVFQFGPGGHLDPPNVWSIDSSRRDDAHGVFNFPNCFHCS